MIGGVMPAILECLLVKHASDKNQRCPDDLFRTDFFTDFRQRAAYHALIRPGCPEDDHNQSVGAIMRHQFTDDLRQITN